VFGHGDKKLSPQNVFAAAKLTPREMKTVVCLAQDMISTLAGLTNKADLKAKPQSHEDAVHCDADNLMCLLEKQNQ
jgi:hypothetical protein